MKTYNEIMTVVLIALVLFILILIIGYCLLWMSAFLIRCAIDMIEAYLRNKKAKRIAKQHVAGGKIWATEADYILHCKRESK